MNLNNPGMQFNDIKQLLITKFMLGNPNKDNDIYYTIIIMIFLSFLNYIFSILPTISRFFTDRINKKLENISTNIITIDKPVKSRIHFSRNYKQNEGYELIDALIEYLSNIDSVISLNRKKFYVIGQKELFKVNDNITCHLKTVSSSAEDEYEIDFELYSYTLNLTELRKWVDGIYKKIEYDKQNKFGDDKFFFNENSINNNIPSKNLMFSMTRFQTNKSLDTLYGSPIKILRKRVDLFKNNSLWYKKNGIPHTLGILLHGLPGTGKSSTIKAIAQDLNRHIFNLKLTKNTTQQQMWNLFYNDSIYCLTDKSNNPTRHYIPTDQRLYVLEDVDCLTSVLIDRKIKEEQDKIEIAEQQRNKKMNINMDAKKRMEELQNEGENAKLNLNFLLGLIDGLLETPGRILIMSSNYPDKLDKAILRPGRIDLNMELKECDIDTLREMFYNFYKGRTNQDFNNLSFNNMGEIFTPAYIQKILSDFFDNPLLAYEKLSIESNKVTTNIDIINENKVTTNIDIINENKVTNNIDIITNENEVINIDIITNENEVINIDRITNKNEDDNELCDEDIIKTIFIDANKISVITGNIDEFGLKQVLNKPFNNFNNKFSQKFIKEILENSLDYGMAYDMLVARLNSFINH